MTPRWFWYVAAAALVVVAVSALFYSLSARANGRWVSEAGGAMVLDTRTGTMCVVGQETCFPSPVLGKSAPPNPNDGDVDSVAADSPNPFDVFADSPAAGTRNPYERLFRDTLRP